MKNRKVVRAPGYRAITDLIAHGKAFSAFKPANRRMLAEGVRI